MKTIIFDLWGDWAHFKKFYTTASPLSFHFPPVTALKGVIGSILGLGKEKSDTHFYLKELEGLYCAVQILRPIKTFRMGYNWIETKGAKYLSRIPAEKGRYQTVIETVKDPAYRIYVAHPVNDSLIQKLENLIKEHCCVYTPYLGISEHLANFQYISTVKVVPREVDYYVPMHTVISLENIRDLEGKGVMIQEGRVYQRDRIPVAMNEERVVTRYESVLYEMNAKEILVQPVQYWETADGINIHFFV